MAWVEEEMKFQDQRCDGVILVSCGCEREGEERGGKRKRAARNWGTNLDATFTIVIPTVGFFIVFGRVRYRRAPFYTVSFGYFGEICIDELE